MKNILKAEFKKAFAAKFIYILLAVAIFIPLVTSGLLELIDRILSGTGAGDGLIGPFFSASYVYATSFNPVSSVGIILLITLVVLGANDFSQNTIRNKIIAGYPKHIIFLSTLIYNLIIMTLVMLVHSSATYLFNGIFNGFKASEFFDIFKFGIIAFSSLFVLYTLVTVLMFKFKNIVAPLLIALGTLLFMNSFYSVLLNMYGREIDISFIEHIFPILRIISLTVLINPESGSVVVATDLWWVDMLVNFAHITWLTFLGIFVAKKTDYI